MLSVPRLRPLFRRYVAHPIEAAVAGTAYAFFRVLPIDWASALGGWVGRMIGPRLPISARARRNVRRAFPEKTDAEVEAIVRGMWDNLGRLVAEFPHLDRLDIYAPGGRVTVVGVEYVDRLRDDGRPGLFFSGHLGNWEILSLGATQRNLPLTRVYRAANNRLVDWLYRRGRAAVEGALIPKGAIGARLLLKSLKEGNHLAMLVDQKMNDGIEVPFFGRPAMTAPALAALALRFNCPVVPARVVRLKGAHFKIVAEPPMEMISTGDQSADIAANMVRVNRIVEAWVRDTPEQWLWLHNRWPD